MVWAVPAHAASAAQADSSTFQADVTTCAVCHGVQGMMNLATQALTQSEISALARYLAAQR
jgi:cytochrome c553